MGALKGSIAVRRYVVLSDLPADVRKRFVKGARAHAFMPLDPKADLDHTSGWVSILDGDDFDLAQEKLFFAASGGEQLRIALRMDVLKAPSGEVRPLGVTISPIERFVPNYARPAGAASDASIALASRDRPGAR